MNRFYLDSSAWVKRYEHEAGTEWVDAIWHGESILGASSLGVVEVVAAIARRHWHQQIASDVTRRTTAEITADYAEFVQFDLTPGNTSPVCN